MKSHISHIHELTLTNTFFRKVVFTGEKSQLVVMSIPVDGDIGEEVHSHIEQTLFIVSGSAKAILDGEESVIVEGDAVVVTSGTKHNIVNTGTRELKLYTLYVPANHIDGRVHETKEKAEADREDEKFGNAVR